MKITPIHRKPNYYLARYKLAEQRLYNYFYPGNNVETIICVCVYKEGSHCGEVLSGGSIQWDPPVFGHTKFIKIQLIVPRKLTRRIRGCECSKLKLLNVLRTRKAGLENKSYDSMTSKNKQKEVS